MKEVCKERLTALTSVALPATPASGEKKSLMLLDAEPPADFFFKMQTPITAVDSAQKYMVNTKFIISGGLSEYHLSTPH